MSQVQGWYEDPLDPHVLRWWDGQQWTEHTTVRETQGVAAVGGSDTAYPAWQFSAPTLPDISVDVETVVPAAGSAYAVAPVAGAVAPGPKRALVMKLFIFGGVLLVLSVFLAGWSLHVRASAAELRTEVASLSERKAEVEMQSVELEGEVVELENTLGVRR